MNRILVAGLMIALPACSPDGAAEKARIADLQAGCEALVVAETGTRPEDVRAMSTQSDPTGTTTTISVTGASAPWLCRADPSGVILDVEDSQDG